MAEPIYSPGLEGVIAGETSISTIAGGLQYRGYSIETLAEHATFEEVAHLLLQGELPTADQLAAFKGRLGDSAKIPQPLVDLLSKIPAGVSMMDIMRTGAVRWRIGTPIRPITTTTPTCGRPSTCSRNCRS